MKSALSDAVARHGEKSAFHGISGLDGLLYFGERQTIFPMHTEEGDFFSVNYLHAGAPKVWYVIAKEDNTAAVNLLRSACKGNTFTCKLIGVCYRFCLIYSLTVTELKTVALRCVVCCGLGLNVVLRA